MRQWDCKYKEFQVHNGRDLRVLFREPTGLTINAWNAQAHPWLYTIKHIMICALTRPTW
jgi:hypothetical protein